MRARLIAYLREEHAAHPWMLPGVALTGSAYLGTHLPAILAVVGGLVR